MQANPNPGNGTPNIQRIVPVKKNGFILELQVPAPSGGSTGLNPATSNQQVQARAIAPDNTATAPMGPLQQSALQRQQIANIPNQQQNINQTNKINNPNPNQTQSSNQAPRQIPQQNIQTTQNQLPLRKLFGG